MIEGRRIAAEQRRAERDADQDLDDDQRHRVAQEKKAPDDDRKHQDRQRLDEEDQFGGHCLSTWRGVVTSRWSASRPRGTGKSISSIYQPVTKPSSEICRGERTRLPRSCNRQEKVLCKPVTNGTDS